MDFTISNQKELEGTVKKLADDAMYYADKSTPYLTKLAYGKLGEWTVHDTYGMVFELDNIPCVDYHTCGNLPNTMVMVLKIIAVRNYLLSKKDEFKRFEERTGVTTDVDR